MFSENDAIKEVYAAINRNEFADALKYFDPQVVRIEPAGYTTAGTHHGHAELLKHMNQGRSTWAEGTCSPVRLLAKDDKVIAFLHVKVRLKDKADWIDGRIADVFTFKNGLITEMRTFWENHEALEWLGIKE